MGDNGTNISCIEAKGSNVWPGQGVHHTFVLSGIAYNVDNEATSFHIQRQRLGQGQRWGPCNNNHLCTPAISRPFRSSRFSHRPACLVSFEYHCATSEDDDSRQNLVP